MGRFDSKIKSVLESMGIVMMRTRNPKYFLGRRMKLIESYGIDLVLDVGANVGQYAKSLRRMGFMGEIFSFEPLTQAFRDLKYHSEADPLWHCKKIALGAMRKESIIHVSKNSVSSSILGILPIHKLHAPESVVVSQEPVSVERLDDQPEWLGWRNKKSIWLKLDVQGLEDQVLDGAENSIKLISAIQIELSLRPMYDGQLLVIDMMQRLSDLGFDPVAFESGFSNPETGECLQIDGIFRNRNLSF